MSYSQALNLGQRGLTVGDAQAPQNPKAITPEMLQALAAQQQASPSTDHSARDAAMADILSHPVQVTSGSPIEAIADALSLGLRGRAAQSGYQRQQDDEARQNKYQDALQQHQQQVWGEAEDDRATAAATRDARKSALETIPQELRPYAALGIEGPITQYFRNRYPTPHAGRAGSAPPELPSGFQWSE